SSRRRGGLRHQAMAAVYLVRSLKPRCQIHGVAHHGVAHHELRPDAADQRFAGRDANPDIALHWDGAHTEEFGQLLTQGPHALDHVHRGEASEMGLICLLNERGSPIRHDRIADVLIDNSAVAADWLGHDGQVAVHDLDEPLRRHAFTERREPLHVAEHYGHHPALTLGGHHCGLVEQVLSYTRIDVSPEDIPDPLIVAQPLDHAVERNRWLTNFVPRLSPVSIYRSDPPQPPVCPRAIDTLDG